MSKLPFGTVASTFNDVILPPQDVSKTFAQNLATEEAHFNFRFLSQHPIDDNDLLLKPFIHREVPMLRYGVDHHIQLPTNVATYFGIKSGGGKDPFSTPYPPYANRTSCFGE